MSKAHLFNSADGLVPKALRGLIAYNPALALDIDNRVVFDTSYDRSKVAIVSGGGSGHEPAWAGYVGTNLLAASAAGDIFASPSTKQILAAVNAVPSDAGTILVITNYTGDCLHFGLAAEKANAAGHKCRMIICGDDVSVGKSAGRLVGRRGLAGQISVLKVMGGCAGTASNATLDNVYHLGVAVSKQIVSMAATLEHCHVPGRGGGGGGGGENDDDDDDDDTIGDSKVGEKIEIGTGPHNEPGYRTLSPAPTAPELVANLLKHCLDETDADRAYVRFAPQDETAVLISNFGGLSQLELSALVDEVLCQIERDWSATVAPPSRVYAGCLETSLNAPAFSLSVINLSAAARDPACVYSVDEIKGFFDVRTSTYWESFAGSQAEARRRPLRSRARASQVVVTSTAAATTAAAAAAAEEATPTSFEHDILVDASRLEKGLRKACTDLVEAEPDLTKWDTLMGDGDCGETLKTGALAMLAAVDDKQRPLASFGSSVAVLRELESVVETKMGGTLGGILGIFLVSLRASLEAEVAKDAKANPSAVWASALHTAIDHLEHYTPAKVGDRTVMDTLIPFAESMARGFAAAVSAAEAGAEKTRTLTPKLGRATYVGASQENSGDLPPDPGAWGVMVAIRGLQQGFDS